MIFNPVVGGGSDNTTHNIIADLMLGTGFPTSAKKGDYVVDTSGWYIAFQIYDATQTYIIANYVEVDTIDELPPSVKEKLENVPTVLAPPPGKSGYAFFVMPDEDVYLKSI